MRPALLKAWQKDAAKVKNLSSQYVVYDDLIKNYGEEKGKIDPNIMKKFLLGSSPKLNRQRQFMHKLENIFKKSLSHFIDNYRFYQQHKLFSRVLLTYQTLNIHRKQLFELIQQTGASFEQNQIRNFLVYYVGMIEMHHGLNPEFKIKLKNYLFKETINTKFSEKHPSESNHLLFATNLLNNMLMDKEMDLKQAQVLLSFIENTIFPTIKKVSLLDKSILKSLVSCRQYSKLHGLILYNKKFQELLNSAVDYYLSQRIQSDKTLIEKQNYKISFNETKDMEAKGSRKQFNLNVVGSGMSSIFQTKFQRKLEDIGYDFKKNVMIGLYEYDFLIRGKKYKSYRPFQNLKKGEPFKPITQQEWNNFKSMKDFSKITINEKWAEPIIVNLNGPSHYIDSDVYGNERVTRTDEMKIQILKNYGYKRFNDVHYAKWQEVDEKGVEVEGFIETILKGNKLLK